ncbi:MAG: proline--tRNA ligase [Chloroflexi bacterium]|nr:proline--tRNA ligase [Chloroflexota bacterium]
MRVTELFGKTMRDDPAEAELVSHKLMIKAGMIYQVGTGLYAYLPLAWRSLRKIEQIIREEMDAAGGQEIRLSIVQPQEIWDESGRTEAYGPDLFRLKDRRERPLVLAPTHEELLTNMVKANVHSYRDLPLLLYQIHTKFRDEPRPRGGLIRVREFDMKDAYSFDADEEGLDKSYRKMVQAYKNIYSRCGLDVIMVDADSGAIGGKDSNEFILLTDAGEDTIILCPKCGYAANAEKALFTKPPAEAADELPLEELETPGIKTIEALAEHLGVSASQTLKAVFYMADGELVFVVIRGDLDVNEVKLRNTLGGVAELRLATPEEVAAQGIVAGSASPVGLSGVKIVADDSIELGSNFVVGANKPDRHLRNANHGRDFKADVVADIALAREGYACPNCGDPFETSRGIEVGHVFKLGTRYSDILGALYPDQEGNQHSVVMGCYGIGLGRLLAAAVEQHNDDKGMILPEPIAPYLVSLLALNIENEEVVKVAEELYEGLQKERVEVLFDDRADSAGVKFNDADLLGLPLRLVVSPRNLKQGVVEIKRRSEQDAVTVPVADVVKTVKGMLST